MPRCPGDTEGEESAGNAWHSSLADLWGQLGGYRALHLRHDFAALPQRCHDCKDWMVGAAKRVATRDDLIQLNRLHKRMRTAPP